MIGAGAAGRVLVRRRSRAEHAACALARGRGAVTYARTAVVSFLLVCAVTVSGHVLLVVCAPAQAVQSPQQADPRINEIDRLIEGGKLAEARALLTRETAERGTSYQALFREAKILFRERNYQNSLKVLERCLGLNKQDPEVYRLVASDAILLNRIDIAEQALKTASQLAPDDYMVLFNLGALYYTNSRFAQAQPMLENSVKLKPDYVPARVFLGLALEELGQEQSAMDSYLQAIELTERSGMRGEQPYLYLGRLLYRQNKIEQSLPYLQKAVHANPQSCEGLCLLSRALIFRARQAEALAALNQCVQVDPKYPEAHYLLSRVYVKDGRARDAAKELALFQKLKRLEQNSNDPRKNQQATR
jgi:tetratricopeptide (TPR) repeat protein